MLRNCSPGIFLFNQFGKKITQKHISKKNNSDPIQPDVIMHVDESYLHRPPVFF